MSPAYSLDDVPNFLKPTAANTTVRVEPPNGIDIARVTSSHPNVIQVNQPDQFGQPQLNHEDTHVYEFSRNPAIVEQMEDDLRTGKLPKSYTYGGTSGLLQAQLAHKTIADFGPEQHAEMVRNYQQESQDAIRRGDVKRLDMLNRAYGPFLRQLANLPGKNDSMTTMTQQDLTPPAPGLPPAALSGIMAALPMMSDDYRVLPRLPSSHPLRKSPAR